MTREEAAKILSNGMLATTEKLWCEAFNMAIKALEQNESAEEWYKLFVEKLEQEPCDAISREDAIKALQNVVCTSASTKSRMVGAIEDLPSVQPSECEECAEKANAIAKYSYDYGKQDGRRKGHWIDREEYDADRWKCSECGRTEQYQENFCPNCGAEMESEE